MIWLLVLAGLAGVVALVIVGRSIAGARLVPRDLLELGTIDVPARLEPRAEDESPERVLFRFDRVAGSITMMGSFTPILELLWQGPPHMRTLLAEGKLVHPLD